MFVKHCIHMYL